MPIPQNHEYVVWASHGAECRTVQATSPQAAAQTVQESYDWAKVAHELLVIPLDSKDICGFQSTLQKTR